MFAAFFGGPPRRRTSFEADGARDSRDKSPSARYVFSSREFSSVFEKKTRDRPIDDAPATNLRKWPFREFRLTSFSFSNFGSISREIFSRSPASLGGRFDVGYIVKSPIDRRRPRLRRKNGNGSRRTSAKLKIITDATRFPRRTRSRAVFRAILRANFVFCFCFLTRLFAYSGFDRR